MILQKKNKITQTLSCSLGEEGDRIARNFLDCFSKAGLSQSKGETSQAKGVHSPELLKAAPNTNRSLQPRKDRLIFKEILGGPGELALTDLAL